MARSPIPVADLDRIAEEAIRSVRDHYAASHDRHARPGETAEERSELLAYLLAPADYVSFVTLWFARGERTTIVAWQASLRRNGQDTVRAVGGVVTPEFCGHDRHLGREALLRLRPGSSASYRRTLDYGAADKLARWARV